MKNNSLNLNTSYHQFEIDLTLEEFKKYHMFIEDFLEKEKNELDKAYTIKLSQLEKNDNDGYSKILEEHFNKREHIIDLFPHNFRASFLIQIVTFIESTLFSICLQYEAVNNTKYSIQDLKGNSDMEKAKMYLSKSCGVTFEKLNPEWQFILVLKKLRNSLIHNQGHVKKNEKDWTILNNFNSKNEYYKFGHISEYNEAPRFILKSKKLTEHSLIITEKFFCKLLNQIDY